MDDLEDIFKHIEEIRANQRENVVVKKENGVCYECKSVNLCLDKSNGMIVCVNCGTISEESLIDDSPEWIYTAESAQYNKDPSRCGCPINPHFEKSSMSTKMVGGKSHNTLMQRIHNQMSMDYTERARWHVFERITQMAGDNISAGMLNDAKEFYITLSKRKLSRGDIRKGLIACCIMYASKSNGYCRSVKETADMCNLDVSVVTKAAKIFEEVMHSEIKNIKRTSVDDLVCRFVNCIGIPFNSQHTIVKRVNSLTNKFKETALLQGKTPSAVTSAMIIVVCNELGIKIQKNVVAEKHQVSQVTLNKLTNLIEFHKANVISN
jgi:transcription initiation factor TFIIIB Brf1 subunit/transcription initiation factor TFIIB